MVLEKWHKLDLLEALEKEPEVRQVDLAIQVGVAVGTVNWYLKRWAEKGYVKMRRISRWRWSYLVTPKGVAEKARLASEYMEASFALYRRTRTKAKVLLHQVKAAGYKEVTVAGGGDMAEIVELTCLELGLKILHDSKEIRFPILKVKGPKLELTWPDSD